MGILFAFASLILVTVGSGVYFLIQESTDGWQLKLKVTLGANLAMVGLLLLSLLIWMVSNISFAASDVATTGQVNNASNWGYIAAALSTGLATLGAGYAVGSVGSSALGAVSENPKILGKTLIFVGLAEGIAIYGLIISILILGRL